MNRRVRGGYKSEARQPPIGVKPILALACEGDTEATYASFVGRLGYIRVNPYIRNGLHGRELVEVALSHASRLSAQYEADVPITPAVIYDLESTSNAKLALARDDVGYANANGVKIWISVPVLERWFVLHFKSISPNRSASVFKAELNRQLASIHAVPYRKPGSIRFYSQIMPLIRVAQDNCEHSHITGDDGARLPCICDFVRYIESTAI